MPRLAAQETVIGRVRGAEQLTIEGIDASTSIRWPTPSGGPAASSSNGSGTTPTAAPRTPPARAAARPGSAAACAERSRARRTSRSRSAGRCRWRSPGPSRRPRGQAGEQVAPEPRALELGQDEQHREDTTADRGRSPTEGDDPLAAGRSSARDVLRHVRPRTVPGRSPGDARRGAVTGCDLGRDLGLTEADDVVVDRRPPDRGAVPEVRRTAGRSVTVAAAPTSDRSDPAELDEAAH